MRSEKAPAIAKRSHAPLPAPRIALSAAAVPSSHRTTRINARPASRTAPVSQSGASWGLPPQEIIRRSKRLRRGSLHRRTHRTQGEDTRSRRVRTAQWVAATASAPPRAASATIRIPRSIQSVRSRGASRGDTRSGHRCSLPGG